MRNLSKSLWEMEALAKLKNIPGACAEGGLVSWKQNILGQTIVWARVTEDMEEVCIMWGCEELFVSGDTK